MARVKITETVLRDGHQSIAATRMRLRQMLPVLEAMDELGYNALECWGGATFDTCMRFLDEDPWERLRTIKKHVKKDAAADAASRSKYIRLSSLCR